MKLHKSDKELYREKRPIGLTISGGIGRGAFPSCHMKYEVIITYKSEKHNLIYQDIKIESGRRLQAVPNSEHFNGTKKQKQKAMKNYRPEFFEQMVALPVLLKPIEDACLTLDEWKKECQNI